MDAVETDGQQQRGPGGRRLRYFMARQVQREHDGRIPRVRILRAQQPPQVRLRVQCQGSRSSGRFKEHFEAEQLLQARPRVQRYRPKGLKAPRDRILSNSSSRRCGPGFGVMAQKV